MNKHPELADGVGPDGRPLLRLESVRKVAEELSAPTAGRIIASGISAAAGSEVDPIRDHQSNIRAEHVARLAGRTDPEPELGFIHRWRRF